MKINPENTKHLLKEIKNQKSEILNLDGVKIKTCPNVFPPRSVFSRSSDGLYRIFGEMKGRSVIDVGTGTGVQAIQAACKGANRVVAVDISDYAISCALENVKLNNFEGIITVVKSNLFSNVGDQKFDVIIANLPITDYPASGVVEAALYDPEYILRRRFLDTAPRHLLPGGSVIITHTNFKGEGDFEETELMFSEYGFVVSDYIEEQASGYLWRLYRLKRENE